MSRADKQYIDRLERDLARSDERLTELARAQLLQQRAVALDLHLRALATIPDFNMVYGDHMLADPEKIAAFLRGEKYINRPNGS